LMKIHVWFAILFWASLSLSLSLFWRILVRRTDLIFFHLINPVCKIHNEWEPRLTKCNSMKTHLPY
jgi:hypothetical protein